MCLWLRCLAAVKGDDHSANGLRNGRLCLEHLRAGDVGEGEGGGVKECTSTKVPRPNWLLVLCLSGGNLYAQSASEAIFRARTDL